MHVSQLDNVTLVTSFNKHKTLRNITETEMFTFSSMKRSDVVTCQGKWQFRQLAQTRSHTGRRPAGHLIVEPCRFCQALLGHTITHTFAFLIEGIGIKGPECLSQFWQSLNTRQRERKSRTTWGEKATEKERERTMKRKAPWGNIWEKNFKSRRERNAEERKRTTWKRERGEYSDKKQLLWRSLTVG